MGAAAAGWGSLNAAQLCPRSPSCVSLTPHPTILVLSPDLAKRSQKFITLGLLGPPGGAQCSNGEGEGRTSPHEGDRLTFQVCLPPCGSQPSLEPEQGPWALWCLGKPCLGHTF